MKKLIFILIPLLVSFTLIFLSYQFIFLRGASKGALQVTASPQSKVFLNGKQIGQTPLCKCEENDMLATGEYTIRLVPNDSRFTEFQEKITITRSVLTVVDRKFGEGADSEGSIISLSPIADKKAVQLLVLSLPDRVEVLVDESVSGFSPVLLKDLTVSDHTLKLRKNGYKDKTIRIRTQPGYKLTAIMYLSIDGNKEALTLPEASPSASPTPAIAKVEILQTPTGFLRVRSEASTGAGEVGRVTPGETFEIVTEEDEWYQIKLANGKQGWVSSQYARKL
ncbi:MAG: SH3 domain-containing protein [Candidatus Levybacteria bacterium]|nr:SH3 domain-containing protein [Candidatus Levybacteria bacterium]